MYGYSRYVPLNSEEILKRTTEEEIFKIVIQKDIVEDKEVLYKAPYREDLHPDCWFEYYNNRLWFVDFAKGTGLPGMSCFDLIKKTYNVNFGEALEIINDKLKLGLGDNKRKAKEIAIEHGIVEEKNVKKIFKERVITFIPRDFNYKDKLFWSKYEISRQKLIEDGVIPIELYQSTSKVGKKFSVRPYDLCYAYTKFVDIKGNLLRGKVKLYRPYAPKEGKWFTNCNQNHVGGLESLPEKGDLLIIAKSYKDYRVLRNFGLNVVWFQNEGQIPSQSILLYLCSKFDRIVVWFDNDSTGITNSSIVKDYINSITNSNIATTIMIPPSYLSLNITDPSDYLEKKNKEALLGFLKNNRLL